MANTYTQITIQVVFAVKYRERVITKNHRPELYKYIAGIINNKKHKLLSINGVADHVHILFGLDTSVALSDIVRDIKNNSSRFINQKGWIAGHFEWQSGYGGFSYSRSQRPDIIRYIEDQEEHHKRGSFREEYLKILDEFEIEFSDQYLFDFFDDVNS
jgi:REP element-mobilizing transposase RayT